MPELDLLAHLRTYLVAEGLVRDPGTAGELPPLWLEPRLGPPAPGELSPPQSHPTAVLTASTAPGVAVPRHEQQQHRIDGFDLRFRVKSAPLVRQLEPAIRARLADRRDWDMAGLRVIESLEFRPLQLLGSDEQGFDYVAGYLVERYVTQPA